MSIKRLQYLLWTVIVLCMIIGGFLGIYLIGKETGDYPVELMLPITIGVIGGLTVFLIISKWSQKRRGNVPEIDERTLKNLQKYFLGALYFILIGSGAALLIAYAMGVKTIETGLLILCLGGVYLITIAGVFVVKRI
ncbi:hypothetical protein [Lysinibacillus halotolerans]|nr:hypothetical protein [Lysinibacillus halotolerans]